MGANAICSLGAITTGTSSTCTFSLYSNLKSPRNDRATDRYANLRTYGTVLSLLKKKKPTPKQKKKQTFR